ncbi:ABC transporter substrate-binding protein [Pseudomonas sp. GX19020]|uniref:ABC transporter substrate-binding protein n=1 Tax=Pseudomonadota TaxID=1224 RepID=UPI00089C6F65|nr:MULTISPECIES: ABC transporter substrate-binding protein [Pseudomonadota]MCL4065180.1 ABC transporter substrate-binding protein [Pseudomonas sp. GX19020]SEB91908.1 putative spermidine/putrescine transport system substrate-binding protein [Rhodobacter sp. 24-YEA-8]
MKKLLVLSTALGGFALPALAQEVTVMGWGGAYANSQIEAYFKPFTEKTGIKVNSIDSDNPAIPVKAQVDAGNVTVDVAVLEIADAVRLCDEGQLVQIDGADLPDGADGTKAMDDFLPGTVTECMVAADIFATIIGYDTTKFAEGAGPKTIADFFDTEKFPGKRGVRKNPKVTLEMALMADGVPAAEVYALLETPEGVDRAFAKLDTIKKDAVFWDAGAQPPQLLADGEVVMTMAYNGRIFNAAHGENKPFDIVWDGQVYEWEGFSIPKGAPNEAAALELIKYATSSEVSAKAASYISYGPPRKSAAAFVGNIDGSDKPMLPNLPTAPQNLGNALASSQDFWVDRDTELGERYNAWLVSN